MRSKSTQKGWNIVNGLMIMMISIFALLAPACEHTITEEAIELNYSQEMKVLVGDISRYAKQRNSEFWIVPQNAETLMADYIDHKYVPDDTYISYLDAVGKESFRYGHEGVNTLRPNNEWRYVEPYLDFVQQAGKGIWIIEYADEPDLVADAYQYQIAKGYGGYVAETRSLETIPVTKHPLLDEPKEVNSAKDVRHFLYILNYREYKTEAQLIEALKPLDYDAIVLDAEFKGHWLNKETIEQLQVKPDGSRRRVLSYLSIGEAENYRFYWNKDWKAKPPEWLGPANPDWKNNYKVKYWMPEWKAILMGSSDGYLDHILDQGFDGVYLDLVDAYQFYEEQ